MCLAFLGGGIRGLRRGRRAGAEEGTAQRPASSRPQLPPAATRGRRGRGPPLRGTCGAPGLAAATRLGRGGAGWGCRSGRGSLAHISRKSRPGPGRGLAGALHWDPPAEGREPKGQAGLGATRLGKVRSGPCWTVPSCAAPARPGPPEPRPANAAPGSDSRCHHPAPACDGVWVKCLKTPQNASKCLPPAR